MAKGRMSVYERVWQNGEGLNPWRIKRRETRVFISLFLCSSIHS